MANKCVFSSITSSLWTLRPHINQPSFATINSTNTIESPSNFQLTVNVILLGLTWHICCAILDDICCYLSSVEQHIKGLEVIFERLANAGLILHPKKCHFLKHRCHLLGFKISGADVRPAPDRTKDGRNFLLPENLDNLRTFLGKGSFFRTHVIMNSFNDIGIN